MHVAVLTSHNKSARTQNTAARLCMEVTVSGALATCLPTACVMQCQKPMHGCVGGHSPCILC